MYTKQQLKAQLESFGIPRDATVLVHSSMKGIGEVEGGADSVLDIFMDYFRDGLLLLPTHTWANINADNPVFDPQSTPSCVGILTNLFMKRPGVVRSLHPTHSVAAYGRDALTYVAGEEQFDTPCPRHGCWGKLYDRSARIIFLGCTMASNTYLHGVEEWNGVPERLMEGYEHLQVKVGDKIIDVPQHRHHNPRVEISQHYIKMRDPFIARGIVYTRPFGSATAYIGDARGMADFTSECLSKNPDLFIDFTPLE